MKNKYNIVHIGPVYPYRGGISASSELLLKEFKINGYEIYCSNFKLQYPSFLFPGKTQYYEEKREFEFDSDNDINSINPINWIRVGYKIKKLKPDFVLLRFWMPFFAPSFGTITKIVKRNKHTKIIALIDNLYPHEKRFVDNLLIKYFVNQIDGAVFMSRKVQDDFIKKFPNISNKYNPHPLYNSYGENIKKDKAKKFLNLSESKNYLLFFGFIRDYKGLHLLIDSMPQIVEKNDNIELIIAGEFYTNKEKYLDQIESLNLGNKIHIFDKFISDNEVKYYFSAADIIVQPYISATQSGVSMVAYHFEKPMLVTNVGGLNEIVPHNKVGYCVNPSIDEISNSIFDFYSKNKEEEFINNIKTLKKEYSMQYLMNKIIDLYKEV